jgi:hypothetical protein
VASKRTTHKKQERKKVYAMRRKAGRFKNIQSYKPAHSQDVKRGASRAS